MAGDSPYGEDLALDHEFETLRDEIGKDKSLHRDRKTDWVVVYGLADSLLARSKDVWLFAYGIIAVYHTKTAGDCARCIDILSEFASTHWQSLHPSLKRPKRRAAPLRWMCDAFHNIAENTAFMGLAPAEINALNDALGRLQDTLDSLLPDNDLTFKSVMRAQLGGSPEGPPDSGQPGGPAAAGPSAPPVRYEPQPMRAALEEIERNSIIPSAALPQIVRTVNDHTRQLGDHLLALNREDERAYLLHRVATWSTLLQMPPADVNGLTQLSCPVPPDMIDTYTTGVNAKRYAEVLPQIERAASKAPFWLDGQYMIVKCLEGLSITLPAFSIKHSLAQFIRRFPDMLSLKFRDGRPFASAKTVGWINSFLLPLSGGSPLAAGGQPPSGALAQAREGGLLQDALALALEKGFKAGLDAIGAVPPGKTRAFLRHCVFKARYCVAAGEPQAATHILKATIDKLKNWDLLEWEPELTAEAISLLLSLPTRQKESEEDLQALLHTLCLETAIAAKRANNM